MRKVSCSEAGCGEAVLEPLHERCQTCGHWLRIAYHTSRTVRRLDGRVRLTLKVRRCRNRACSQYKTPYRPEAEGAWALPATQFGLDVIALVGHRRFLHHRSVPEIHAELRERGLEIGQRTVTHLLHRYEELVALQLGEATRLREVLGQQGRVILAIDGLQPDQGHEVLWVVRDTLSGEVLLARSLVGMTCADLAALLTEVRTQLENWGVQIAGVLSDGQVGLRGGIAEALPGVPHQLCQFHYLREATKLLFEADRRGKAALKAQLRGLRQVERTLEAHQDPAAEVTLGYCLALRSALTDDGPGTLCTPGLRLWDRLEQIEASLGSLAGHRPAAGGPKGGSRVH